MNPSFNYAFGKTVYHEGGLSNHPLDRGGLTKYGVTENTWRAYCMEKRFGDSRLVSEITLDDAKAVYAHGYWEPLGLDAINDGEVAAEIFDTAVNCGTATAAKIAQRAYNLIRPDGAAELTVDGRMGPVTRQCLNNFVRTGYRFQLLAALNVFQGIYYIDIVEGNPKQRAFIRGWMGRCLVHGAEK